MEIHLPKRLKELIIAYAENDMNRAATARAYKVTSATIWHRFNQIESMTGLDPRRFYDMVELVKAIEEQK